MIIPKWARYGTICDEYFTLNESLWNLSQHLYITTTPDKSKLTKDSNLKNVTSSSNPDLQQLHPLLERTFSTVHSDKSIVTKIVNLFYEQIVDENDFNDL